MSMWEPKFKSVFEKKAQKIILKSKEIENYFNLNHSKLTLSEKSFLKVTLEDIAQMYQIFLKYIKIITETDSENMHWIMRQIELYEKNIHIRLKKLKKLLKL